MTDTDPSATLAGIREDIEATVDVYDLDGAGKNSYPVSAAMVRHARVLLAAVEAALKLADEWEADSFIVDPEIPLREAITSALTGEEAGDGERTTRPEH